MKHQNKISAFFNTLSIILWTTSLFCTVFFYGEGEAHNGIYILTLGSLFCWFMGFFNIGYFAVYANYFWMAAVILYWYQKQVEIWMMKWLLVFMWVLAILTFSLTTIHKNSEVIGITGYGAGFYLWFAALFCATIGILLGKDWLKKQKKKTTA
ncbi:Uncharacterised protein [Neisseria sicca]|nr:Uncharacterised protein [Neisseria sicca]